MIAGGEVADVACCGLDANAVVISKYSRCKTNNPYIYSTQGNASTRTAGETPWC